MNKKQAIRQILEELMEQTNVIVRLSTEVNDTGQTSDYAFATWAAEAFLYDDGQHPGSVDGHVRIGSATALVLDSGWDANAVAADLDDHSEWYADIGRKLTLKDRPGLQGLYEECALEIEDAEASGLLIIPEIDLDKDWRGHKLSVEVINAIVQGVGRHAAFTVIDPEIFTEDARDEKATARLVKTVEEAGFVRWYSTSLFIRPNIDSLDLSGLSETEVIPPHRHELNFGALIVAPTLGMGSSTDLRIGVPLPDHPRSQSVPYPLSLGIPVLRPAEVGGPPTIVVTLPESQSDITVTAGPDGVPMVGGYAPPEVIKSITPWALAVYADCTEFAPVIEQVIRGTLQRWFAGDPTPAPAENDVVVTVSPPPRFATLPSWVDHGEPHIENLGRASRTDVVHRAPGQPDVAVGTIAIEWPSVFAEIRPDLGWSEADERKAVEWMWAVGGRELSVMLIASAIAKQAYAHLTAVEA